MLQRSCEILTEGLIYLMVIFSPWAFGTTQRWAIWTMNIAGYALGTLWLGRRIAARLQGYDLRALQMRKVALPNQKPLQSQRHRSNGTRVLGGLTVGILGYCLVSAINARASFQPETMSFEYHDCCRWLPHSFDRASTWFAFWTYLALAGSFWSIRDWLGGPTTKESAGTYQPHSEQRGGTRPSLFPARAARLLTLLALIGGLLAGEGLVQRASGTPNLLFAVKPRIHQTAATQFGPYAYRANAAQYLNLLWPLCLGFWSATRRQAELPGKLQSLLLFCTGAMCTASLISGSRAGALICAGMLVCASLYLIVAGSPGRFRKPRKKTPICLLLAAPALGLALGWSELVPASPSVWESVAQRQRIYGAARQMAKDFGVFGAGPGTYESVSELYRPADGGFWPAQVHSDWLETLITFGSVGSLLILAALGSMLRHTFSPRQTSWGNGFVCLSWLGLAGCLVHAAVDFPFQVHSVLFLFMVVCAILFCVSGTPHSCGRNLARRLALAQYMQNYTEGNVKETSETSDSVRIFRRLG